MAGHKKTPNAKPIINITIDEKLLDEIEDFRFENRLPNRSQAIVHLIKLGMEQMEKEEKE
jgi:metal-responsive CopG/Arc/MetJ family transcriptional regulator